mmetsp:Transcript_44224/g.106981  ORF Transcript_44224/g.106981 Transcript_44224/m.106981 type:complete len:315 (+) Transcript_44224:313-1257(+)
MATVSPASALAASSSTTQAPAQPDTTTDIPKKLTIAIFFSSGAFGDCARHTILHAIQQSDVAKLKIYSNNATNMASLQEANWKCGCHKLVSAEKTDAIHHGEQFQQYLNDRGNTIVVEQTTVDVTNAREMEVKCDLMGVDAVISGLGNRQIWLGDRVARHGTRNIVAAMKRTSNCRRLVVMTSMGINEDEPGLEWRSEGKFMAVLFRTICRREYKDLAGMETDLLNEADDLDYVLVRPLGLGEGCIPRGEYFLQKQKGQDVLGPNMAKSDVVRFLSDQAITPTYMKQAVVIGADPEEAYLSFMEADMEAKKTKE